MTVLDDPIISTLRRLRDERHQARLAEVAETYRSPDAERRRLATDAMNPAERALYRQGWNDAAAAAGECHQPLTSSSPLPWSTDWLHEMALTEEGHRQRVIKAEERLERFRAAGAARYETRPQPGTFWEHQELNLRHLIEELHRAQEV
ncbi:hypothetical protein [Pseudonocardia sp. T1-2H]|uniref:hypothetical protein n=1 Tax=Pseudonocardia sp. T1-2H TaxID=3128899 RepID=UPI003100CB31